MATTEPVVTDPAASGGGSDCGNYIPLPDSPSPGHVLTYVGGAWVSIPPAHRGIKIYDIPGTYTWVCPVGIYSVEVAIYSAGGGGGQSVGGVQGGGGGSGAFGIYCIGAVPGTSYTLVVGAGGASGGGNGGDSTCNIGGLLVRITGGTSGTATEIGRGGVVPYMAPDEGLFFSGLVGSVESRNTRGSYGGTSGGISKDIPPVGKPCIGSAAGWAVWHNTGANNGGGGQSRIIGTEGNYQQHPSSGGQGGTITLRW